MPGHVSKRMTAKKPIMMSDGSTILPGGEYWVVTMDQMTFKCSVAEYERRFGNGTGDPVAVPMSVGFNPHTNRWEMVMSDGTILF